MAGGPVRTSGRAGDGAPDIARCDPPGVLVGEAELEPAALSVEGDDTGDGAVGHPLKRRGAARSTVEGDAGRVRGLELHLVADGDGHGDASGKEHTEGQEESRKERCATDRAVNQVRASLRVGVW